MLLLHALIYLLIICSAIACLRHALASILIINQNHRQMKKLFFIATVILFVTTAYGQPEERFTVNGTANLIATWTGKIPDDASGTLTSGDTIEIQMRQVEI